MNKFPAGPEQNSSLLTAANEEACLQVISQSETRRQFGGVGVSAHAGPSAQQSSRKLFSAWARVVLQKCAC